MTKICFIQVRVYDVNIETRETYLKSAYPHEAPVLSLKWSSDGTQIISGGPDNIGRLHDIKSRQTTAFAHH